MRRAGAERRRIGAAGARGSSEGAAGRGDQSERAKKLDVHTRISPLTSAVLLAPCHNYGTDRNRIASDVQATPSKMRLTPTAKPINQSAEMGHCTHSKMPRITLTMPLTATHP